MAKRERRSIAERPTSYFVSDKPNISFISSGCTLLDCALGGGYPLGRMVNVVGDKSTAKTALATEAMINFLKKYPDGTAAYRETEAAYDREYAEAMGLPVDKVDFGDQELLTVEEFERDFTQFLESRKGEPSVYVIDSLDALSDEAEMKADLTKGTYGMAKPKMLGIMFRKLTRKIERTKTLLMIVSQVRDNINAMFGEKHRRSGGKALDFYATQVVWLAHMGMLKRTIKKVERPYGIEIKAKIKKNKISLPFREAEFDFIFGFGVDDAAASAVWLKEVGHLDDIDVPQTKFKEYLSEIEALNSKDYAKESQMLAGAVIKAWREIEVTFLPTRSKYGT